MNSRLCCISPVFERLYNETSSLLVSFIRVEEELNIFLPTRLRQKYFALFFFFYSHITPISFIVLASLHGAPNSVLRAAATKALHEVPALNHHRLFTDSLPNTSSTGRSLGSLVSLCEP